MFYKLSAMDTTVIILMIICATIIALVAIICDHFFERKIIGSTDCMMSKKIIKVHRNYIAGFLGFSVIMLITAKYGGPENTIFTYLSFGSTITSLVLSILAIFVTVQSSSDIYKQFGTINNVSSQIDRTLVNFREAENKLEKTSSAISSQMNNIVNEIAMKLDERMQKTEETLSEQIQKQNVVIQPLIGDNNKQINAGSFIKRVPYSGLLALYACSKGFEAGKMFKMSHLFKGNERYQLGVIMTATATGFISCSVQTIKEDYMVKCLASVLKSDEIFKIIEDVSPEYQADAKESVRDINLFFDQN
jgi:hypothetical protein